MVLKFKEMPAKPGREPTGRLFVDNKQVATYRCRQEKRALIRSYVVAPSPVVVLTE